MNNLNRLVEYGQSVWLDYIRRSYTRSGALAEQIERGVRGVTSNPSIFEQAIGESDDYDDAIRRLADQGRSALEIYEALAIEDIREAADQLRPLYDESAGVDGRVSLEVSPELAHDTQGTLADARRLRQAVDRPNLLVKIPATPEGIPAIRAAIAEGISINVTLIFSLAQYEQVFEAWLAGMEKALEQGRDLSAIVSVASVFVSRIDTAIDALIDKHHAPASLKGTAAVDNTRLVYARFTDMRQSARCQRVIEHSGHLQRPLWASTGTKNPDYPDTKYIDQLIGPETVNTAPLKTIEAFLDHGVVQHTIKQDLDGALERRHHLALAGIDIDKVLDGLLNDGVIAFSNAFEELIDRTEQKSRSITST